MEVRPNYTEKKQNGKPNLLLCISVNGRKEIRYIFEFQDRTCTPMSCQGIRRRRERRECGNLPVSLFFHPSIDFPRIGCILNNKGNIQTSFQCNALGKNLLKEQTPYPIYHANKTGHQVKRSLKKKKQTKKREY